MNRTLAFLAPLAALLLAGCSPTKDSCHAPSIRCDGKCIDPTRDPSNCGACGTVCSGSQTCCGVCTDVASDAANCGACGAACPTGGTCTAGACSCPPAQPTTCGTNPGACVDLTIDPEHCGTCGQACAGPGVVAASATCSGGACQCAGPPGARDCPGESPQCRNTQTDPNACGDCGTVCPSHATCASGACACGNPAFPNRCPTTGPVTQCVNFATDPANCGDCGFACSGATPTCSNRLCCASGRTNCSNSCVDTQTDAANCGACGSACPAGQACSAGHCGCPAATPQACGGSCCAGTGCCGSACQTGHDNGFGQRFFDCTASYTPATTTATAANLAAQAWGATTIGDAQTLCGPSCTFGQRTGLCAIWCFGGSLQQGQALQIAATSCNALACPFLGTGAVSWPIP